MSEPGLCVCVCACAHVCVRARVRVCVCVCVLSEASVQKQADESVALHCIPELAPGAKGWLEEWGGDNHIFIQFLKNDETIYGFYLLRFSISNRKNLPKLFFPG